MEDFNVAARVQDLCKARSWSLYRLAKEAGMPYSSLSTILYKTAAPSIASIERLCTGFGITLAQFFSVEDEYARLKKDEKDCLASWEKLGLMEKQLTLAYMQALIDRTNMKF